MIVLELFAGTRSIGKAFEKNGHKVISIDWDKNFKNIDLYEDINNLTKEKIIELCGGGYRILYGLLQIVLLIQ